MTLSGQNRDTVAPHYTVVRILCSNQQQLHWDIYGPWSDELPPSLWSTNVVVHDEGPCGATNREQMSECKLQQRCEDTHLHQAFWWDLGLFWGIFPLTISWLESWFSELQVYQDTRKLGCTQFSVIKDKIANFFNQLCSLVVFSSPESQLTNWPNWLNRLHIWVKWSLKNKATRAEIVYEMLSLSVLCPPVRMTSGPTGSSNIVFSITGETKRVWALRLFSVWCWSRFIHSRVQEQPHKCLCFSQGCRNGIDSWINQAEMRSIHDVFRCSSV